MLNLVAQGVILGVQGLAYAAAALPALAMVATLAGPLGYLGAGLALRHVSLSAFFLVVPALLVLASLGMAAVLLSDPGAGSVVGTAADARPEDRACLRQPPGAAADDLAVPYVAHGQA